MQRFDRLVELYQNKYGLDVRQFVKFIHQKIDSPSYVVQEIQKYIVDLKMKMNRQDLVYYLNIVSAAQQEIKYQQINPEEISKLKKIKLLKNSKVKKQNKTIASKQLQTQKKNLFLQINQQQLQINRQKIEILSLQPQTMLFSINKNFQLLKQEKCMTGEVQQQCEFTLISSQESIQLLYQEQEIWKGHQGLNGKYQKEQQILQQLTSFKIKQIKNCACFIDNFKLNKQITIDNKQMNIFLKECLLNVDKKDNRIIMTIQTYNNRIIICFCCPISALYHNFLDNLLFFCDNQCSLNSQWLQEMNNKQTIQNNQWILINKQFMTTKSSIPQLPQTKEFNNSVCLSECKKIKRLQILQIILIK